MRKRMKSQRKTCVYVSFFFDRFLFSWWERGRDWFLLMRWEGESDLNLDRFEWAEDSLTWRLLNLEAHDKFPSEACLKGTKLFGAFDCRCPVKFLHSETTRCPATISSVEIVRGRDPVTMPSEIEVLATVMTGAYTWLEPIPLSSWARELETVEGDLVSGDTKLLVRDLRSLTWSSALLSCPVFQTRRVPWSEKLDFSSYLLAKHGLSRCLAEDSE